MADEVFARDRQIRNAALTMPQTFYLITLNQFVGRNAAAWPSQSTIAEAMNATTRSVRNWQCELEELGIIEVEIGAGRASTNRYRLRLDKLPQKGGTTFRNTSVNEEPRSAFTDLNEERHSAISGLNEEPRSAFHVTNEECGSPLRRNDVPLNAERRSYRKNKKEHMKEQEEVRSHPRRSEKQKFQKPTVNQIREYATTERDSPHFDAEKFHDYYESNGWRVGRNPMKDWRAAVRKWLRDDRPAASGRNVIPSSGPDWSKALEVVREIDVLEAGYPETLKRKLGDGPTRTLMRIGVRRIQDANDFQRREMAAEYTRELTSCR